jgi:hypothetical protein
MAVTATPALPPALLAALDYARRGWRVLPLHAVSSAGACTCGKADCESQGKHPRTQHGVKDSTTDSAIIRRWWTTWPTANVAIATGPESGLWMLGPDGQAGIDALLDWQHEYGALPATLHARSGGGGEHHVFAWPAAGTIANHKNHLGKPIDIRGAGGYFVAPPSRHKSGRLYEWLRCPDGELAQAPPWLLEWARTKPAPPAAFTVRASARPSVEERAIAYLAKLPPAISGQGGHARTLDAARAVVYGFDLGPEVGYRLLADRYNSRCEPPWSEAELRHKCAEAARVPYGKPRGWLLNEERPHERNGTHQGNGQAAPAGEPPWPDALPLGEAVDAPPFPLDVLPPRLSRLVEEIAWAVNCPPDFPGLAMLALAGGALGNARHLAVTRTHIQAPILYVAYVGRPGSGKSAPLRITRRPFDAA